MTAPIPAATPSRSQSTRRTPQRFDQDGPEVDRACGGCMFIISVTSFVSPKRTTPSSLSSATGNIYRNPTMYINIPFNCDRRYYCLY